MDEITKLGQEIDAEDAIRRFELGIPLEQGDKKIIVHFARQALSAPSVDVESRTIDGVKTTLRYANTPPAPIDVEAIRDDILRTVRTDKIGEHGHAYSIEAILDHLAPMIVRDGKAEIAKRDKAIEVMRAALNGIKKHGMISTCNDAAQQALTEVDRILEEP